jgi:pimeloyl-ACP methyl ester carboxylesterase
MASEMKFLFFGSAERKLYGSYHPAGQVGGQGTRSQGIVLCYPGVQEYNVTHGAFRKLAALLSRSGVHVLRFDYFGTGDSAGRIEDGSPEEWISDIRTAVAELSELAGVRRISLVGFRLGAALAATAVSRGLEVADLVLWDPIVIGRDYVKELEQKDRQQNIVLLHPTSRFQRNRRELLGYPFPLALRASLEQVDLRSCDVSSAERVALVVTESLRVHDELRSALSRKHAVRYEFVQEDEGATNRGAREEVFLAAKVLTAMRDVAVGQPS